MGGGNAPMLPYFHRPCRILVGNGCNFSKLFDISEDWNPIKNAIFLDSPGKVSFKNSTLDQTNLINNSLNVSIMYGLALIQFQIKITVGHQSAYYANSKNFYSFLLLYNHTLSNSTISTMPSLRNSLFRFLCILLN